MFGKLNTSEIDKLIRQQLVGRIGCHADGVTYVVPISYVYADGYVYAHSFNGMKMDMMRSNPKVCFQVDNTSNLASWQGVVCWGEFEELEEEQEKKDALQKLNKRVVPALSSETMHITPEWPFTPAKNEMTGGIFFRIKLVEKTGRFEKGVDEVFFAS